MSIETCKNCKRVIGELEQAYVWQNHVICKECHDRLSNCAGSSVTRDQTITKAGNRWKRIAFISFVVVVIILCAIFVFPTARTALSTNTTKNYSNLSQYKDLLRQQCQNITHNMFSYTLLNELASAKLRNGDHLSAEQQTEFNKLKPRYDTEAIADFHKWISINDQNSPDSIPIIRNNAAAIEELIEYLSYKKDKDNPDFVPSKGFMSGQLSRNAKRFV